MSRLILHDRGLILPRLEIRVPGWWHDRPGKPCYGRIRQITPLEFAISIGVSQQGSQSGSATTTSGTATTQATGSAFVIFCIWDSNKDWVSIADNKLNTGFTQIQSELTFGGSGKIRAYYLENALGGAGHTFTFVVSNTGTSTILWVELLGGLTSGILDANPAATTDAATPYVTASTGTLAQANEAVVAMAANDTGNNTAFANSSGYTIQQEVDDGGSFWVTAIATKIVAATTAESCSFTRTGGGTWGLQIASFKAAAGGGTKLLMQSNNLLLG